MFDYVLVRAVIAKKKATGRAGHAAMLGWDTRIPVSRPSVETPACALPHQQPFREHTATPGDLLKKSSSPELSGVTPPTVILNNHEERRGRSIALTVESIVRCMAIATDEQNRKTRGAMSFVAVIIAFENDKESIRFDGWESDELRGQIGDFDVRRPAAGAQVGLWHLLFMLNGVASKPIAINPTQPVADGLLRNAMVHVHKRMSGMSLRTELHRVSVLPGAWVVHGSQAEESRPVEYGRYPLKPIRTRLAVLLQSGDKAHV